MLLLLTTVFADDNLLITADSARGSVEGVFAPFQELLAQIGFNPMTADPGSERFQQFAAAAILVYLFVSDLFPVQGIFKVIITIIIVGSLETQLEFNWFEFIFGFGPSLFVYYMMNDILNLTIMGENTKKLLSIFSMFVVYFFMATFLVDFWARIAVILQMSGWTLLLFAFIGMAALRIGVYFMNRATRKAMEGGE